MSRFNTLNICYKVLNYSLLGQSAKLQCLSCVNCISVVPKRFCSPEVVSPENSEVKPSVLDPVDKIDLTDFGSGTLPKFTFAMCADKSPIIQKFLDLGVNLYEIEKHPEQAQFLVTLNFEKIKPYLVFLKNNGVSDENLGKVITKNPFLFKEDLEDLQVRINYLMSKKFDSEMISNIITSCPKWLSIPVRTIDERLGFLQQTFKLKGDDVRHMIARVPSLALKNKKYLITNIFTLKEEMGLDEYSLKKVVVKEPQLLRINVYDMMLTYEYLTKTMNVPLALILKQPKVLTYRKFIFKERHKFLESLGRAQYCNLLPSYVNLMDLVGCNDDEFCEKVAKTSVKLFYDFLKTL